ncbi:MAG: dethiobiotin synthase [Puniceicoccales bacterium]|jgi:dethiobiotin synthase|nr:dethiobiotin synthase [Puniceicoccales bacterium]
MNIFVTGTDTDVGKTIVSAWICRQTGASYWKPLQTDDEHASDRKTIERLSPNTPTIDEVYRLKAPLSPYDAANSEKISIDIDKILQKKPDKTVIEGAGGLLVPVAKNCQMIDLAEKMNAKVVIVAQSKLGFLNHIFLTVEALKNRAIPIAGIVLNGEIDEFLAQTVEAFSGEKILKILPYSEAIQKMIADEIIPDEIKKVLTL